MSGCCYEAMCDSCREKAEREITRAFAREALKRLKRCEYPEWSKIPEFKKWLEGNTHG